MNAEHVVIVRGAIMGSYCAWSLRDQGFTGKITVVEKDSSYQFCSTALSTAIIRLQFATGFSGPGVMHAPAVGRSVAQPIVKGGYQTLDLTPLGWDRIHENRRMVETVVF